MKEEPQEEQLGDLVAGFASVHSDLLKNLRVILRQWKGLQPMLGEIAQFQVVVDTNVILRDLIWLSKKRSSTDARTHLMEVIEAETVEVYAPPALVEEVEEKIPLLAEEKGIDKGLLLAQWKAYRSKLKVKEPSPKKVTMLQHGVDPDDAFFVALAEDIGAHGVISNDHHIKMMGGNLITVECVTSLRDYSRAITISMNIKVSGVLLTGVTIGVIQQIFLGIKALASAIGRAPDWVKIVLLAGGFYAAFHPGARTAAIRWLKGAMEGVKDVTPIITNHIAEAAVLSEEHGRGAKGHLEIAMQQLGRNSE